MSTAVSGTPRRLLRLEGVVIFAAAVVGYRLIGGSWGRFGLLLLLPDIGLIGYAANARLGAVTYNSLHTYIGPAALALLGLTGVLTNVWPICLIWMAHIGMDRALGLGLKYGSAFGHTHLGAVGGVAPPAR